MPCSRRSPIKLSKTARRLIQAGLAAQKRARCSFTGYPVGASVLGASGRIYPGCNIESPTDILHVCAERAAIFNAVSHGEASIEAVCTVSRRSVPCGVCRQAILEFGSGDTPIYSVLKDDASSRKKVVLTSISKLLPMAHTAKQLKTGAS